MFSDNITKCLCFQEQCFVDDFGLFVKRHGDSYTTYPWLVFKHCKYSMTGYPPASTNTKVNENLTTLVLSNKLKLFFS